MDAKDTLRRLAIYYGGVYTEIWEDEACQFHRESFFTVELRTPRTVFKYSQYKMIQQLQHSFEEEVRYKLIWSILQKGVEYVNEQSDIFKMFNPGAEL